jgi:hypothetical protein
MKEAANLGGPTLFARGEERPFVRSSPLLIF